MYSGTSLFFFFNDTATTEIYTLSLHDALPIYPALALRAAAAQPGLDALDGLVVDAGEQPVGLGPGLFRGVPADRVDRKSTRLNSSHANISYAVFCLKKKKKMSCYIYT